MKGKNAIHLEENTFMKFINDELLVEVFVKAITLEYNKDVIDLLENEIIERKIDVYEVLEGNNIGY